MTAEALIVFAILAVTIVLFVTQRLPYDLTAVMAMLALVLTGVLTGSQVIQAFGTPAVITVGSVLVLSGGLLRTGVANIVGRYVLRWSGESPARLLVLMMLTAGLLSGIMNNIGVAALMLPVVLDIARRTGQLPSKLLIPLAYASLLGGMTTLLGTAPNILISGALQEHGMEPFRLLDFTPLGLTALAVGIVYMLTLGRRLLPTRDMRRDDRSDPAKAYGLGKLLCKIAVPAGSALEGRALSECGLGRALGLNVLGVARDANVILAPGPQFAVRAGDRLIAEGNLQQIEALRSWRNLVVRRDIEAFEHLAATRIAMAELELAPDTSLAGRTLRDVDFRNRFGAYVLAIRRDGEVRLTHFDEHLLEPGDRLFVVGTPRKVAVLRHSDEFSKLELLDRETVADRYELERRLQTVEVPKESLLAGKSLLHARLGEGFQLMILGVVREGTTFVLPGPGVSLQAGDLLLVKGRAEDFRLIEAFQDLELSEPGSTTLQQLQSELVGIAETALSPRTTLAGRTVRELDFRKNYGVSILAIWRDGQARSSDLRDMRLGSGDAFLVYGERHRLDQLAKDPDFYVLNAEPHEVRRPEKAAVSCAIMVGVLGAVAFGLLPIFVAAPVGAALMVLTGCLEMSETYTFIDLRVILLIAGMLGVGMAMEETGAASMVAETILGPAAGLHPRFVLAGLFLITVAAAQVMPTAGAAVLMTPIALSTAGDLGLSPRALLMVVAVGSSCAFLSPVGHPANLLVMGFGGYRFTDYTRVGFPLVLLLLLVVVFILPLVWPL